MEKKIYLKPQTEVVNIRLESIIATSPAVFSDPMPPSSAGIKINTFDDEDFDNLTNFDINSLLF